MHVSQRSLKASVRNSNHILLLRSTRVEVAPTEGSGAGDTVTKVLEKGPINAVPHNLRIMDVTGVEKKNTQSNSAQLIELNVTSVTRLATTH